MFRDPPKRVPSKKWHIETWLHRGSGVNVSIYYSTEAEDFWCRVGDELIVEKTQAACRAAAARRADEKLVSEERWKRIIIVAVDGEHGATSYGDYERTNTHNSDRVGFDCLRTWISTAENGQRYTRAWDREPRKGEHPLAAENRAAGTDVKSFWNPFDRNGRSIELPYSDEAWEALMKLSEGLAAVRTKLEEFTKREDFLPKLLASSGGLLLAAATATRSEEEG